MVIQAEDTGTTENHHVKSDAETHLMSQTQTKQSQGNMSKTANTKKL